MDYSQTKILVAKYGQEQLLQYYDQLTDSQKQILLDDIQKIDFSILENLNGNAKQALGELEPADALSKEEVAARHDEFENVGLAELKSGNVAAVLLAGGMGTRLGSNLPKGMFNIGETRELSIFQQQFDNIYKVTNKCGKLFHIFVMTSTKNDEITRKFFAEKNYFDYDKDKIHFFVQDEAPACSADGKIFLEEKYKVATSPNGNGGWYASLVNAGLSDVIEREGIKWLNIYSVDNVLQAICDPVFIGAMISGGYSCAGKVVKKVNPQERVGVMCKENGSPSVIEYYEMPEGQTTRRDESGELTFRYGVTLNYIFSVAELNDIYKRKLPYHLAKKAIAHIENGEKVTPDQPNGYKFETLVVDMIRMTESCLAVEVEREKEFAPVKNKTGADSVETARALLKLNGVQL
jgi:UDP-N-acetylglucosamine/UDP-N-acetylgalactosamine diphosphorylase